MEIPFWEDDPGTNIMGVTLTQWDVVKLIGPQGTATLPGIARVSPIASVERQLEDVPGQDGGVPLNFRYKPLRAQIELDIWTAAQLNKLHAIIALWGPKRDREVTKLEPVHPYFDMFEVDEVYILDISAPPPTAKDGALWTLTLEEYWAEAKRGPAQRPAPAPSRSPGLLVDAALAQGTYSQAEPPSENPPPPGAVQLAAR